MYESKGKQFAKKPDLPVGMCPIAAKASRDKRERQQQQQNKPGLISLPKTTSVNKKDGKSRPPQSSSSTSATEKKTTTNSSVQTLTNGVSTIDLNSDEGVFKQLKKLRKKIREIESIEGKLKSGELKVPEQDQLDKVARKSSILKEIKQLEELQPAEEAP